ncbi:Fc.00g014070.m01.CDS01 [Cosmosporella sp. VM-42]
MDYIDMFLDAFKAVHSPKVDQVVVRALMMRDGRISPTVIKSPQVIVVNKNSDKGLLFELPGGAVRTTDNSIDDV